MHNFTYWNPTKLIFGRGEVERLPEELKSYGKNVLLVYGGGSIKRSGLYDQVIEQLNKAGVTVHELAGVEPNPRVSTVNNSWRRLQNMSTIQRICLVLTIIGAINWGLIGFFQFDLVAAIFGGQGSALSRIIYGLVGIAGLINLGLLFKPNEERSREEAANPEMR